MKILFSTRALHPRDRFDCWHQVACKTIVDHVAQPDSRQSFEAELHSGSLSDLALILFETSPMAISHDAGHAARASAEELFVCRQVAGTVSLEQDGREVALKAGDFTLLDPRMPYRGRFGTQSRLLVVKMPRRQLEARLGRTRDLTACRMVSSESESSLTSAFLQLLPGHVGKWGSAVEDMVRDQLLDLTAVSLANTMRERRPRISTTRSLALMNLRAAVEARLTEPALDVETVATAAGISRRYANALLAQEGISVSRLIQERRLERCRKALEDPVQTHRTISEIAYGWGFSDMTHFARRFRAAYGILPSEYRHRTKESNAKQR